MLEHLHRQVCNSGQRRLKQQQGKCCSAQGLAATYHPQDSPVSLLSLAGLSPCPLPAIPTSSGFQRAHLPISPGCSCWETALREGNPLINRRGCCCLWGAVWLQCSWCTLMGQSNRAGRCAARSVPVSGSVRSKITSIVERKRNLVGELMGFFFFFNFNYFQRICLSVNIILS